MEAQALAMARFASLEISQEADPMQRQIRERKIKAAMAFLRAALKDGPRPGRDVEAEALAAGHARSTLHLARQRAFIRSERIGTRYIWSTPAQRKQTSSKAASKARSS